MNCPFHSLLQSRQTQKNNQTEKTEQNHDSIVEERRNLLKGLGAFGGAVALGSAVSTQALAGSEGMMEGNMKADEGSVDAEFYTSRQMKQPFYGAYQSGILNPPPAAACLVSFDVIAYNKDDLKGLFKTLTERAAFLTQGGKPPSTGDKFPPLDSGIVGTYINPDNLTLTVALGASLFDERFGLADKKPKHLVNMTRFPNDALQAESCHGDLLIQFCANSPETVIHAMRDIIKHTPATLSVRWRRDGFISNHVAATAGKETPINLLGFKDGTVNPNTKDPKVADEVILVTPENQEPKWATGGSYLAVRTIRFFVEQWDRTPLQEQEAIFGRERGTGAPLGMKHEHDIPDYSKDPKGKIIPLDAHMRLANPRTPGFNQHQLLRRAYNYSDGVTNAGQLEMGLLFLAYQADLKAGFITVQERLNGEPLEEYIKPFGGGYFFALPGVKKPGDYFAQGLLES
ncbi:Deferrochelatase/peroxidase EfeB precursor [Marinomonas spartinae]|uniref:Deferrochelatase n=1 Tax=Marinomonas spartinae TaxID=1792290 RepID=A0A1A8TIS7_9GAMM|nr:iron uptake transporter deferrochelatase/peroxidase subunit [Marinomonas spartinae]SBS32070.1 Deferrochelatase/peroxidase EfeB precursor [Marinomonas spartinae]